MSHTRIPEAIKSFNSYINVTDDYQLAIDPNSGLNNWQRLGLTSSNSSDWHSKRVFWRDTLFKKYADPMFSTSGVKTEIRNFMRDFRTFGNPLLAIIASSPVADIDDEQTFRFKLHRKKPGYHTIHIQEPCDALMQPMGGGQLKITCRIVKSEGRPRKPMADSIQMAYSINNPAARPDDGSTTKEISTKCIFILKPGMDHSAQKLYAFFRWYNTRHPHLAGGWSEMLTQVIA